jgi:hypothetical protein
MTTKRTIFRVVPFTLPSSRKGWRVTVEAADGYDVTVDTCALKGDAVRLAQERCRRLLKWGGIKSQLVLHDSKGKLQTEFTYGSDPRESPG